MGFVVHGKPRERGPAAVRFDPRSLSFNTKATRLLEGVTHLRLLHDPETGQVAFEPTTPNDPAGYKVVARNRASIRVFSLSFVNATGHIGKKFELQEDGARLVSVDHETAQQQDEN